MARNINAIFNECLERIQQGESIESCLSSYPEYAAELQPMLSMYLNVRWRGSMPQPRPEFKAQARAQFIYALQQSQQAQWEKQQKSAKKPIFQWHGALVPTLAAVLLMLFSGVGTVAASSNSLPDEPLYPVKIATEKAREILTFSDEDKAKLQVTFVETRVNEIEKLADQGKTAAIATATTNLVNQLDKVDLAIKRMETAEITQSTRSTPASTTGPLNAPTTEPFKGLGGQENTTSNTNNRKTAELKATLDRSLSNNISVLEKVLDKVPTSAKTAIQNAIDTSNIKRQQNTIQPNTFNRIKPPKTDDDSD